MTTVLDNRIGQPPATGNSPGVRPYPAISVSATARLSETAIIERDADLYHRVTTRIANAGETVAAEDVLGPLDEVDEPACQG